MASEISKEIGKRIRAYRKQLGLSQEKLAYLSDCHPTYIGQLERGEKNATLESIEKITIALNISLSQLFEKYEHTPDNDIPTKCYNFLLTKNKAEQIQIYQILLEIDKLRRISK